MKTIIIGDVHGCDKPLHALLDRIQPGAEDTLVMLGDLFDRGPDSYQVFQTVQKLAAELGERFILLRGNHEDYLLQPKLSLRQRMIWNHVGRGATVSSFASHRGKMEDAVPWLKAHCRLYWKGAAFQCVHAGLLIDPLEINDTQTLIHDHDVALRNIYSGPLTIVGHIALNEPTWFIGDRETIRTLPYNEWIDLPDRGVICIDTGCGKGGSLTAMIVENRRYILESVGET